MAAAQNATDKNGQYRLPASGQAPARRRSPDSPASWGQVSVEGVGLAGVTVTMPGEGEDAPDVTVAGGLYAFSKLRASVEQIKRAADPVVVTLSEAMPFALDVSNNVNQSFQLPRTSPEVFR